MAVELRRVVGRGGCAPAAPAPDAGPSGSATGRDPAPKSPPGGDTGWTARLALDLRSVGERTVVASEHIGPLFIQRPFYPEDGACHVYLLHPPGGLAGGDRLVLDARSQTGTAALATTPAATKFYRSLGAPSHQEQRLDVAAGASFEWLPLDTILFGGSRAVISTRVSLAASARFIGWEMCSLGRPLSGDGYRTGTLDQRTEIFIAGEPRLLERMRWRAGDPILARNWGLGGRNVIGAFYAYPADDAVLASAREQLAALCDESVRSGATRLDDLLVVRALADRPESLREAFESVWIALRRHVIGLPPCAPRIWRT